MHDDLKAAFAAGYERMAAWSDLLDDINLYPVADADTGRNLRISLAPLKNPEGRTLAEMLLLSATGNSGNIAGAFFSEFTAVNIPDDLRPAARKGNEAAWRSLLDPKSGTMLSVFDALANALASWPAGHSGDAFSPTMDALKDAVLSTTETLPELKRAGVVDAGALGMFIFFEGFFHRLADREAPFFSLRELFGDRLDISGPHDAPSEEAYCIDAVIHPSGSGEETTRKISDMGDHVVAVSSGKQMKVHFHASNAVSAREELSALGALVRFDLEKIEGVKPAHNGRAVHLVSDAAGSLTRKTARELGMTLLESYILMDDRSIPETLVSPDTLYEALRKGAKVTTAQASSFERSQYYESLVSRHDRVLYLCVGSAYTGNHQFAAGWRAEHPLGSRMTLIDSGAASGKLGLLAHHAVRYAASGKELPDVVQYIQNILSSCDELLFPDQLKYLVAGGRLSKTKGFFGDLLSLKPVIRPAPGGVQKLGVVKNREAQIDFTLDYLGGHLGETPAEILIEYTDNQEWVLNDAKPRIEALLPAARIILQPMSLTSGVHLGPGAWGVAFLPIDVERFGNTEKGNEARNSKN